MILRFSEIEPRVGLRGVSAGRLAGPWGKVLRRRQEPGRDKQRFMPYGGEHHAISRVEDLPEVTCPHCGRDMKRQIRTASHHRVTKDGRNGDRPKNGEASSRPKVAVLCVSVVDAVRASYSCPCGWGFEVVSTQDYTTGHPRDAQHCNLQNLLPAWPALPRSSRWHELVTKWNLPPAEIAARAAVIRAFRERARKLSRDAEKQYKAAYAVRSRGRDLKWCQGAHRLPWGNDEDKEEQT